MPSNVHYIAKLYPAIPTLEEINASNDPVRTELMLLRCICASDLAARFMLMKTSTVRDIIRTSRWLLDHTDEVLRLGLSPQEEVEYIHMCNTLDEYCDLLDALDPLANRND